MTPEPNDISLYSVSRHPRITEVNTMSNKVHKEPYTERELEKNVPESAHETYGGQHDKESVVPDQVKRDGKETRERLKHEIDNTQ
tara:strand:- start:189 stop:443 length:255 start_codon:yes stop_codon:yes gene_type:complete